MRGYRFMLSRRWLIFALAVALGTYAFYWLGLWQWHRLESRRADNAVVRTNEAAAPAPVAQVLGAPGQGISDGNEWRTVTATGTYDVADTVIVRYRSDDHDSAGVDVVVPLRTASGTSVLVDRGFFATDATPDSPDDVPPPPSGTVTVTGYARVDGTGDSTAVTDQSTRAISSATIGPALGIPVYGGFVQLRDESPAPAQTLAANDLPDLGTGPHFFYALQWWFFGILAVFGFFYLAYDEKQHGPRGERPRRDRVRQPATPAPEPTPDVVPVPASVGAAAVATTTRERRPRQTNVMAEYQRPRKPSRESRRQSARSAPPSTGSMTPETKEAAGESTKAATRPNSSGAP